MKQKIRMPGTGPPLGTRVFATAHLSGWRLFPRGHPFAHGIFRCIRTDEDVGWWFGPNPEGLGNLQALKSSCKAREPAWPATRAKGCFPGSIAVGFSQRKKKAHASGIAVGFNQRIKDAHSEAGLQPHLPMWLKPEELFCSFVNRQLKQTEIAREPAGRPPEKVCRSGTRSEAASVRMDILVRVYDGTVIHIRDDTAIPVRDGPDGENLHRRHRTAVRAGYSTGLGSRNAATRQPVHPPEWERYARGRRSLKFRVQSLTFIPIAIGTKFKVLNAGNGKSPGVVPKAFLWENQEPETRNCDRKM